MAGTDQVMARIQAAVERGQTGDRGAARGELATVWEEIGPGGDALHRCVLAHHLADLQEDPADELAWDQRALDVVAGVTDERARAHHDSLAVDGFLPSLHLNLAEDHRRLGDPVRAREHADLARARMGVLGDDGYGRMIRAGIERIDRDLGHPGGGGDVTAPAG